MKRLSILALCLMLPFMAILLVGCSGNSSGCDCVPTTPETCACEPIKPKECDCEPLGPHECNVNVTIECNCPPIVIPPPNVNVTIECNCPPPPPPVDVPQAEWLDVARIRTHNHPGQQDTFNAMYEVFISNTRRISRAEFEASPVNQRRLLTWFRPIPLEYHEEGFLSRHNMDWEYRTHVNVGDVFYTWHQHQYVYERIVVSRVRTIVPRVLIEPNKITIEMYTTTVTIEAQDGNIVRRYHAGNLMTLHTNFYEIYMFRTFD